MSIFEIISMTNTYYLITVVTTPKVVRCFYGISGEKSGAILVHTFVVYPVH